MRRTYRPKVELVRETWNGPGSIDQIIQTLARPLRFEAALEEIQVRSGVTLSKRTLEREVRQARERTG